MKFLEHLRFGTIVADPRIPPTEVRMVDRDGQVLARMVNLKPAHEEFGPRCQSTHDIPFMYGVDERIHCVYAAGHQCNHLGDDSQGEHVIWKN